MGCRRAPVRSVAAVAAIVLLCFSALPAGQSQTTPQGLPPELRELASPPPPTSTPWQQDVYEAIVRLPIAAVLGAALALRPRRRGTPTRTPAVVQTQIILAVVGAVLMLVIGASLARAFGIVGAANLIRYRSKIDDPKDAGVMLCCLAVGLASGVGLFSLAVFSTVFLVAALAVIESFEPTRSQPFELKVTVDRDAAELRPRLEGVLHKFNVDHSLRAASDEELSYDVKVPFYTDTDRITSAIQKLGPEDKLAVSWDEKKPRKAA